MEIFAKIFNGCKPLTTVFLQKVLTQVYDKVLNTPLICKYRMASTYYFDYQNVLLLKSVFVFRYAISTYKSITYVLPTGKLMYFPSKHSSWWRRVEDFFKISSRRLQRNIVLSSKTSSRCVCKTCSSRRPLANTS